MQLTYELTKYYVKGCLNAVENVNKMSWNGMPECSWAYQLPKCYAMECLKTSNSLIYKMSENFH